MSKIDSQTMTLQERMDCPFKMFGSKIQIRLADLDQIGASIVEYRKKNKLSMKISLIPARTKKFHEPTFKPTYVKDGVTGIFYGVVIGEHPDGNPKWMKIPLDEGFELDLLKENELKWWCVLRMHPEVNISPFVVSEPRYIVVDPEIEAIKEISRGNLLSSVLAKAKTMENEKIRNFARWCDIMLRGDESPSVIRARIISFAIASPETFQSKFEDSNRRVGEIFRSAEVCGLVKHDHDKGYQFKTIFLGLSTFECIEFLTTNTDVLTSMHAEIKRIDAQLAGENDKDKE